MAQGLALIDSVNHHSSTKITWHVLALDEKVSDVLKISYPNIDVIDFDVEFDLELFESSKIRPWRETCWSGAACLLHKLSHSLQDGTSIVYLDADCYFFNDISEMLKPLTNHKIAIHEHNFSHDRKEWLEKSGRFNVGAVAGIAGDVFQSCTAKWRLQVLDSCESIPSLGKCGDQSYLNEWPDLYPELYIWDFPGVGLAPWNLNNFPPLKKEADVLVNDSKLFFFHFHGLQIMYFGKLFAFFVPASGYELKNVPFRFVFLPYVKELIKNRIRFDIGRKSYNARTGFKWFIVNLLRRKLFVASTVFEYKGAEN